MAASSMSFQEVVQNQGSPVRWKEITVNTGGSPSLLQDVKLPESAGGFTYRDSGKAGSSTRNRFIYWRTCNDILELVEVSLDLNLHGNSVRFRFQDTPVLNGVSIHETPSYVVILVATVSSVHRLMFPHPNKIQRMDQTFLPTIDTTMASVFADASVVDARDPSNLYTLTSGATPYNVHTSAAWLTAEGEALFAMATNLGSIILVKLPPCGIQGIVTQHELKQSSMMHRLWTGLVPAAIRGGHDAGAKVLSARIHPFGQDFFIFAVCRDHKLRMWSCKNQECVNVTDLLEYVPDNLDPNKATIGGAGHMIRKGLGGTINSLTIGVYLDFSDRCQFCVFEPLLTDGRYQLSHVTTIFSVNEDLVDFCVGSSHLWTLWTTADGETTAKYTPLVSEEDASEVWQPVIMQPTLKPDIDVPISRDPRETYLDNIFHPGRFSIQAILKALNIYKRSLDPVTDLHISIQVLREEVSAVVEHEIQNAASEYEMAEDEFYHLQLQQWGKFYSCCTQYQEVGSKPTGMFADNVTGMVCVVKKDCLSFLRPTHTVEHLYLASESTTSRPPLLELHLFGDDDQLWSDVVGLCESMQVLAPYITNEMRFAFEDDLSRLESPSVTASQIVDALFTDSGDGLICGSQMVQDLGLKLQTLDNLLKAAETILQLLDLTHVQPETLIAQEPEHEAARQLSCSHLFGSNCALSLLSQSVGQLADTGLQLSRDLLILLTLICRVGQQVGVSLDGTDKVRSILMPRAEKLSQTFYLLKWCCQKLATQPQANTIECNLRQLEAMELTSSAGGLMAKRQGGEDMTLVELFLRGQGGQHVRGLLAQGDLVDEDPCALWTQALMPVISTAAFLLWPSSAQTLFLENLMCQCQYLQLQEYVRLSRTWCEWNAASRNFLLGQCYLNCNEPDKAVECFVKAVHGVGTEPFLLSKLLHVNNPQSPRLDVLYYLKVIKLLEQFSVPHLVIAMATAAVSIAEEGDISLPTLWSKVFKHQLELGHSDDAYEAMIANPDSSRRKDCLRQFIVVLCERGQIEKLVQFPYVDLEDEVVGIIESRARSVNLATHNYYDLLYAFHVFRGNFRRAGSVMYEYGMRLGRELLGLKGLQRQAKCYLAALNVLRLVDPKYAWIVKPVTRQMIEEDEATGMSPKRLNDGQEKPEPRVRKLEVLELDQIEKEYILVHARLQLLQKDPDPAQMAGPTSSAEETVALLVNAGLFDSATNICRLFKMPLTVVFEGLASRCVNLARASNAHMMGDNEYTVEGWDWLAENDIKTNNTCKDASSADQAWRLLQAYLEKYEDKTTRYYKCSAIKLLAQNFALPTWFISSYKRLNAAELLRLLLDYDHLEEASELTLEYIDAVLGNGKEYFGLQTSLHFKAPSVWLPYTCIDQLLLALKEADSHTVFRDLYNSLQVKLQHYNRHVERVSQDHIESATRLDRSLRHLPEHSMMMVS